MHQVGLAERDRPGPGDQQLVPGGQDAAALAVGDHRQPECLGGGAGGLVRRRPATRRSRGPAPAGWRLRQQPGDRRRPRPGRARPRRVAGGLAAGPRRGAGPASGRHGRVGRAEQRLQAHVQEHRAAVPGRGEPERLVDRRADPARSVLGPGPLGDRPEQRADGRSPAGCPSPSGSPGARPASTTTGEPLKCAVVIALTPLVTPGPGGQHGEAGGPGQPGRGLGREHRGLLVPDVHDPHRRVRLDRPVVEREHVPARQREHRLDAVRARRRDRVRAAVSRLLARSCRDVTS